MDFISILSIFVLANPPRNGEGGPRSGGGGCPVLNQTSVPRPIVSRARQLRKTMTLPEVQLWEHLRRKPNGIKFRRQHPIGNYVADFCALRQKLVIEVDGAIHDQPDCVLRDQQRDQTLKQMGFRILRIRATDILKDASNAAHSIIVFAGNPLHQPSATASAGPPPQKLGRMQE